jgi:hypothetical protein
MPDDIKIDSSGLTKAVAIARQFNRRAPQQAAGSAAYFVAIQTSRETQRASLAAMDSQLGVTTQVRYTAKRTGKPLKHPKKTNSLIASAPGQVSVAEKIILARLWPSSKFNTLTRQRWAIGRASFSPGAGIAGFWAKVHAVALKMVGKRHSSVAFLASSLVPVIKQLSAFVDAKYRRGAGSIDSEAASAARRGHGAEPLGGASMQTTPTSAVAKGEMLIGLVSNPLSDRRNEAMFKYVGPALQKNINAETVNQMNYVVKHLMKDHAAELEQCGVRVSV